jgi:long-chain acyl-CoA synthetase
MQLTDLTDLAALYSEPAQRDFVAFEQGDRQATMHELGRWMRPAAGALFDGTDDVVAISSPDVIEHTVAYLGALAAGRRPLLVDPGQPETVLDEAAERAGATVAVGRAVGDLPLRTLDDLLAGTPRERVERPGREPGALLLTSGSTDKPKIVVRSRSADFHASQNFRLGGLRLTRDDRYWLFAPYTGSPWAGIAWNVLVAGATVVVAPFRSESIDRFLLERRITSVYLGPTAVRLAHERDGLRGAGWDQLTSVLSGGERLDEPTAELMTKRWPGAVRIGYGSTEVTQVTMAPETEFLPRLGSVGLVIPLHQAMIADPGGDGAAPTGQEGEILMRGPDMYSGYLGEESAGEWYPSGDLGRFDEEGYLYVTGRATDVVQIGGNRVSTNEVTASLRSHPALANVAVMAFDDPRWTTRLEAFVVSVPGEQLEPDALTAWCQERMPGYKVPRVFHVLDELPQDSSGKLSRRTLQRMAEDAARTRG